MSQVRFLTVRTFIFSTIKDYHNGTYTSTAHKEVSTDAGKATGGTAAHQAEYETGWREVSNQLVANKLGSWSETTTGHSL